MIIIKRSDKMTLPCIFFELISPMSKKITMGNNKRWDNKDPLLWIINNIIKDNCTTENILLTFPDLLRLFVPFLKNGPSSKFFKLFLPQYL